MVRALLRLGAAAVLLCSCVGTTKEVSKTPEGGEIDLYYGLESAPARKKAEAVAAENCGSKGYWLDDRSSTSRVIYHCGTRPPSSAPPAAPLEVGPEPKAKKCQTKGICVHDIADCCTHRGSGGRCTGTGVPWECD